MGIFMTWTINIFKGLRSEQEKKWISRLRFITLRIGFEFKKKLWRGFCEANVWVGWLTWWVGGGLKRRLVSKVFGSKLVRTESNWFGLKFWIDVGFTYMLCDGWGGKDWIYQKNIWNLGTKWNTWVHLRYWWEVGKTYCLMIWIWVDWKWVNLDCRKKRCKLELQERNWKNGRWAK